MQLSSSQLFALQEMYYQQRGDGDDLIPRELSVLKLARKIINAQVCLMVTEGKYRDLQQIAANMENKVLKKLENRFEEGDVEFSSELRQRWKDAKLKYGLIQQHITTVAERVKQMQQKVADRQRQYITIVEQLR